MGHQQEEGFNSVTTDNASVMTVVVQQSRHDIHVGCFGHTLNLATKKGLEMMANVLEICVSKHVLKYQSKWFYLLSHLDLPLMEKNCSLLSTQFFFNQSSCS